MLSFYLFYIKKFFSILNKIFLVLIVYFSIFFLFSSFTQKKSVNNLKTENQLITEDITYYKKIIQEKDPTKEKHLLKTYQKTLCLISGYECQNNKSIKENCQNSLSGIIDNLFSSVFSIRPASSIYWVYNSLEKTGFLPKIYAQNQPSPGIGLASLQFVYNVWEKMRNISYILIVLVLVTIGFMIMFRMKLNPQTVISVESALPKIIVTLILITFSYPIVGFMIDLVYISLPIIKDIFVNNLSDNIVNKVFDQFTNKYNVPFAIVFDWENFIMYYDAFVGIFGGRIFGWELGPLNYFFASILNFFLFSLAIMFIKPISDFLIGILGDFSFNAGVKIGLVGILIRIILLAVVLAFPVFLVFFGMLFLGFRIFFTLLSCLANLIIYIVLAPLYLLFEAIPGKSSFSSWIKNILGNLIVFPGFLFLIYLSKSIYYNLSNNYNNALIIPGLSSSQSVVFFPEGLSKLMASLIGVYIFLMIPDLLKLLKQTIIGKEGVGIPASPGILFGAASVIGSTTMGFANQIYPLKMGYDHAIAGKKNPPAKEGSVPDAGQTNNPLEIFKEAARKYINIK